MKSFKTQSCIIGKGCDEVANKRIFLFIVSVIVIISAFILFHSSRSINNTATAQDLMMEIVPNSLNVSNAITDKFIDSTQRFSIELFKNSIKKDENSLISPASVFLALGMTANGAGGETLNSFINALGKHGLTLEELNQGYKAYSDELTQKRGSTVLNIANSIWFRDEFTPKAEFLQSNADYFGAAARKLNFKDKSSVDVINNWVKENTNNRIDKIIDKIDPDDVMHLINTLYFNAKWQKPFDIRKKASQDSFYLSNGKTQTATFMHLTGQLEYIHAMSASAVLLPYNDGRLVFLSILPDKGIKLDEYIKTFDENTISDLMSRRITTEISVTMPKFKTSGDFELKDALKNIGLGVAFDKNNADISKMGIINERLYISSVKHKTFLQVDELGTEASAVTDVVVKAAGISMNIQTLVFNRPFVYAIIDTKTNLPLFLGTMENPQG